MTENIVKKVCKELGLTYKELGERIGYSEGALKMAVQRNNVSPQMEKAIQLYLENLGLKKELEEFQELKKLLKKWTFS
jgi:transcriptional regulator with XRE-family HTH domain